MERARKMMRQLLPWCWLGVMVIALCGGGCAVPCQDQSCYNQEPAGVQITGGGGTAPGTTPPIAKPPASVLPSNPEPVPNPQPETPPEEVSGKCPRSNGNLAEPGVYTVATLPGGPDFTIYYPKEMDGVCKYPFVAWGNGFGVSDVTTYDPMLKHLASHGFVVMASHSALADGGFVHREGLDYMIKQNATAGSPFYGKIAVDKGATAGHSRGGCGATAGGDHKSVKAVVDIQGWGTASKPTLYLTGTEDVYTAMNQGAFATTSGPAFLANFQGADHVTPTTALGSSGKVQPQFKRLMIGWLRCFVLDDEEACALFKGFPNCGICKDPGWAKLDAKKLPQ